MLARVRKTSLIRAASFLLLIGAVFLPACATKPEPQLVSTGAKRESELPWNQQEKWEGAGQFGALLEQQGKH